jgi:hypothetical protein
MMMTKSLDTKYRVRFEPAECSREACRDPECPYTHRDLYTVRVIEGVGDKQRETFYDGPFASQQEATDVARRLERDHA